jgi:hypothetical protein
MGDFPNPSSVDFLWSAGLGLANLETRIYFEWKDRRLCPARLQPVCEDGTIPQNIGIGMHEHRRYSSAEIAVLFDNRCGGADRAHGAIRPDTLLRF